MKKLDFIDGLMKMLETDEEVNEDTVLKELSVYDSLTNLAIIAYIDTKFTKKLTANQLQSITTIRSLMELVGKDLFE